MNNKYTTFAEASICSFAFLGFAWFINYDFPVRLIAFTALVPAAWIFSRNLFTFSDLKMKIGESSSLRISLYLSFAGLIAGILLAMFYRCYLGIKPYPESVHYFVIVAAMIGALEELVFRGFIQENVRSFNGPFSILYSTFSHTGYKCFLFLSPLAAGRLDVINLAVWTFIFGILFGTVKHFSKSIFPSLIAHVIFDIWVYAEFIKAPWWVW